MAPSPANWATDFRAGRTPDGGRWRRMFFLNVCTVMPFRNLVYKRRDQPYCIRLAAPLKRLRRCLDVSLLSPDCNLIHFESKRPRHQATLIWDLTVAIQDFGGRENFREGTVGEVGSKVTVTGIDTEGKLRENDSCGMTPKKLLRISGMVVTTILPAGMLWLALKIRERRQRAEEEAIIKRSEDWVLTATAMACEEDGRADLEDILAFCDVIHHGIPQYEELDSALRRLAQAGHVIREGQYYRCSGEALAAYEKLRGGKLSLMVEGMRVFIGPAGNGRRRSRDKRPSMISHFDYEWALRGYRKEARAKMREAITRQLANLEAEG